MVCYLCIKPIEGPHSRDHIPPQQFFAPSIRSRFNFDRLVTLPTHSACTDQYGRDEEYFVWSLSPIAARTVAGSALIQDNLSKVRSGTRLGLHRAIVAEFDDNPPGLQLPPNLITKHFDAERVGRVAWKVVRGLYCIETGAFLPEVARHFVELSERGAEPTERMELTRFGGHLTVVDTEVFSESIIEKA